MFNSLLRCSRILSQRSRRHAQHLPPWGPVPGIYVRDRLGERNISASTSKRSANCAVVLRTLHPEHLTTAGQQISDLSGITFPAVCPFAFAVEKLRVVSYAIEDVSPSLSFDERSKDKYIPFPQNTKGFFYYHSDPDEPELRAGVRFRICDSAEQFAQGKDLLDPNGDPWGYTLPDLMHHLRQGFLSVLREDNLVDENLIDDISKLDMTTAYKPYLYSLSEPFVLKMAQKKTELTYITRKKIIKLFRPFGAAFRSHKNFLITHPFSGTIRVKYELSDLPEHERKEYGDTLVLRVLDIIKPMTAHPLYNRRLPVPEPGTLLYRYGPVGNKIIVRVLINSQEMRTDIRESLLPALKPPKMKDTVKVTKRKVDDANNARKHVGIGLHKRNIQSGRRHKASATSTNSNIAGSKSKLQTTPSWSTHTNTTKRPGTGVRAILPLHFSPGSIPSSKC